MCFSATASFSAGAVLIGFGTLTLKLASRPRELLFAAIPLLFAIQQLSEGVIWLTFRYEAAQLNAVITYVYSFFSHVLWPVYLPVAVLLIEPPGWRRRVLLAFVTAGVAVSVYLFYILVAYQVVSRPTGQHIEYVSPHFFALTTMTLYLASTTLSPCLSTYRTVKVFGLLALAAFAMAYFFYMTWFISVWCFYAAMLSAVIYLHFAQHNTRDVAKATSVDASPSAAVNQQSVKKVST